MSSHSTETLCTPRPGPVDGFVLVQDIEQEEAAEARAATARLRNSLQTAKSLIRDYRSILCRNPANETNDRRIAAAAITDD